MSPEQARGEPLDARTDLFSFGTVLYEMASGQRPFPGETSAAVSDSILHAMPPPPSHFNPQLPTELDRIIRKALEKDRGKRFASASEMRTEFQKLRQQRLIESSAATPIVRVVRKPSFIAGMLIVLVLAGVSAGLAYRRYSRMKWLQERALPEIRQLEMERESRPTGSFNRQRAMLRMTPSTWELGSYAPGQDDYPVSGLSWYEAAAYAQFTGKSLPTVFHWFRAANLGRFSDILQVSNFSGKGPAPVATYSGLGPFGTYDMAGNVKEWCLNPAGDRKYILGGASTDPPYMYSQPDARLPFERLATHGVRLVKYLHPDALSETLTTPISFEAADYRNMTPVPDSVFHIYEGLYSYDRTPLEAKIESEDDSSPYWRRQRITFRAAYGNETVIAYLFLPKNGSPPYQTVVYFPHGGAQMFHTVEDTQLSLIDFMVKSGRALLFPIYKDTYERLGNPPDSGTNAERDETIQQAKDLRRSLDYLETRPDIDKGRLAYYGISWGAVEGPIMLAVENRFKAAVLAAGGCNNQKILPEADPMNFASRVKVPVLRISGASCLIPDTLPRNCR